MANSRDWHWIFWTFLIVSATIFIATFFIVHETCWDRKSISEKTSIILENTKSGAEIEEKGVIESLSPGPNREFLTSSRVMSLRERLIIYRGKNTKNSWFRVFLKPFFLYYSVPVLYASILYALAVIWVSVIAETMASLFTQEPYKFSQTSVGLFYIAVFIGGTFGSVVAGKASDYLVRKMSSHNNGIYEPEFSLALLPLILLSTSCGLIGFGWSIKNHDFWIVPAIFLILLGFGISLSSTVAVSYSVDCYRDLAAETLVAISFAKDMGVFYFSFFVPKFLQHSGPKISYTVYGCIQIAVCLAGIPAYHYGKVCRSWFQSNKFLSNRIS